MSLIAKGPPPQTAESALPAVCPHSLNGDPKWCSQCRAAPARRITRDEATKTYLIDGEPIGRDVDDPIDEKATEYARRGGRAHARLTNG